LQQVIVLHAEPEPDQKSEAAVEGALDCRRFLEDRGVGQSCHILL
jgi:hypothetical protein